MIQGRSTTSSATHCLGLSSPALLLMPAGTMAAVYSDQPPVGIMASIPGSNGSVFNKEPSKISLSQRIAMTGIPRTSSGVSLIVKNSSRLVNQRTLSCSESKVLGTTGSFFSSASTSSICDVSSVNKSLGTKTYGKRNLNKQVSEAAPSLISGGWMTPICSSPISSSLSDNKFYASDIKVKTSNRGLSTLHTDAETCDLALTPKLAVAMIPREKTRPHEAANAVVFSSDVGISATNLSQVCQSQLIRTGSVSAGGGQLIKTGSVNNGHLIRTSINAGQKPLILATLPAISASRSATAKNSFYHSLATSEDVLIPSEAHAATTGTTMEDTSVTVVGTNASTDAYGTSVEVADPAIVTTTVCGSGATAIVDTSAGTATLVEGAEVVRSSAVSYATPIMHKVFLQANAPAAAFSAQVLSSSDEDLTQPPPPAGEPGTSTFVLCDESPSRLPVSPPPSCVLVAPALNDSNNNSRKLRKLQSEHGPEAPDLKPPLRWSTAGTDAPRPRGAEAPATQRSDDELTSLSWLQDANLLKGTALSPVKLPSAKSGSPPNPPLSPDPCRDPFSGRPSADAGAETLNMNAGLFRALPDRHVLTKDGPRRMKAESPTSDYGDESMDANDSLDAATEGYSIGPSKSRPVVSSSQQASGCAKPPYSFSCLIFMAIEDSEEKALPVKSIYAWVQHHFPYFRTAPAGWKNSVRHNLSLNKCFSKVDKSPALGKGSLWMVDPAHRPNLLQSLSKVPSHPHGGNDKVFMLSTRASGANRNRNSDPVNRISVGNSASRPLSSSTYTSSGGLSTPSNRQLFISSSSSQPCEPSYHASSMSSSSSSSKQVPHRNISSSPVSSTETPLPRDVPSISSSSLMSATNSPDPTLFPFLARRLGGLGTHVTSSETSSRSGVDSSVPVDVSIEKLPGVGSLAGVGIEDVDAANAMLTLKHGHKAMAPLQEALLSLREGVARQQNEESYLRHKRKLSVPNPGTGEPSSSTQDNSYGPHYSTHSTAGVTLYSLPPHSTSPWSLASHSTSPCSSSFSSPCSSTPPTPPLAPSTSRGKVRSRVGTSAKGGDAGSPTSSVDEAFSDGSFESDVGDVGQQSPSDFQQMVDGADALLNFAARATTLMPQLLMCRVPEDNQHPNAVRTLHAPRPRPNIPSSFSHTQPAVDRTNPTNPTKVSSHQSANSAECRSGSERLFSPIQDHGTSVKTDGDFEEDDDDDLFCSETLEPLPKRAMIESSGERLASPLEEDASSVGVFFGNDSRMSASVDCASAAPDRPEHRPSYSRDQLMQKQSFTTRSNLLKNHPLKTGIGSKLGKARLGNEASEKAVRPSTTVKKVSKPRRNAASKLGARPMMAARR